MIKRPVLKPRFWIESTLAAAAAIMCLVTLIWHDWIELLSGIHPDSDDGSFEAVIVCAFAILALSMSLLARAEYRRIKPT
jgi:hypothetical protein